MKQLILILIILTAGYVCHAQLRPPVQTDTEKRARWKAFWAPTGAILLFFRGRWTCEIVSTGRDAAQFSDEKKWQTGQARQHRNDAQNKSRLCAQKRKIRQSQR